MTCTKSRLDKDGILKESKFVEWSFNAGIKIQWGVAMGDKGPS